MIHVSRWTGGGVCVITHICVGVLSLGLGQRGVTVGAVVFTEVIGSLGVGGDQQLLDVSLWKNNEQHKVSRSLKAGVFIIRLI